MSPRPARAKKSPSPRHRNERSDAPDPARKERKSDTAHAGAPATGAGAGRAPSKDDLAPGCPFSLLDRRAGVLLHPTSLPGPHGSGDIGPAAHELIDRLADAGQGWWQMLPISPPGSGASPYSSFSSWSAV